MLAVACGLLLLVLAGCRNPTVVEYEPYESPGRLEPDDPEYAEQWHYRQINMPGAWAVLGDPDLSGRFSTITVAVIDNGILEEVDLAANLFLDTTTTDGGYEFDYPTGDVDPTDDAADAHGTHVAGTIVAETDNNVGVAGVGWNLLQAMPVKALRGSDDGTTVDVANAIYYSARSTESGVQPPSRDSRVINLSLGGGSPDTAMYEAVSYAMSRNITVIAAAGNTEGGGVVYPAAFDNTIAVSAVSIHEELAWYSPVGPEVDFTAPGGDEDAYVWSIVNDGYQGELWAGTSMATPHVSGVVGLLYSYAPNLTQDAVYAILANTAKDLGEPGHDEEFGHGLIDAQAALEYLINAGRDYPLQPRSLGGGTSGGDTSGAGISSAAVSSLAADGEGRNRGKRPAQRRGAILPEAGAELDTTSIIVKLTERADTGLGVDAARSLADGIGAAGVLPIGGRLYRIDLRGGGVEAAIRALGKHEDVEYAQPNYRYSLIE
jgi:serine protease